MEGKMIEHVNSQTNTAPQYRRELNRFLDFMQFEPF
jgi:hypothetical protein